MATNSLPTKSTFIGREPKDYILMFYGPPGAGKTTFANRLGRVLFLSTDRGTRHLDAMRVECNSWKKFDLSVKKLEAMENPAEHYDFVAIDHLADWAAFAEDETCKRLHVEGLGEAGFGKGWKEYKRLMRGFVQRILALGIGVILIAHEKTELVKTRAIELSRTTPDLQKTAWTIIAPITDLIGYVSVKTVSTKINGKRERKEVRALETIPREDLYLKDRTVRTKPESGEHEPLNATKFLATFKRTAE